MRDLSKAFPEVVREMCTKCEWTLLQTAPCLVCCGRLDSLAGWHGDDFHTEGELGALEEVDEMILASFKAKVLSRLGPGASTEGHHPCGESSGGHLTASTGIQTRSVWKIWQVPTRSRVRNRVRHPGPEPPVVGNAMCWSCGQLRRPRCFAEVRGLPCISDRTGSICSLRRKSLPRTCRRQASCRC